MYFLLIPTTASPALLSCCPHWKTHPRNLSQPFICPWRVREANGSIVHAATVPAFSVQKRGGRHWLQEPVRKGSPRYCVLLPQVSGCPSPGRLGLGSVLLAVLCVTLASNQRRKYSLLPDCLLKTISIILAFQWMEKPFRLAQEIRRKGSVN